MEKIEKNEILWKRFAMKWVINFKYFSVKQSFEPLLCCELLKFLQMR